MNIKHIITRTGLIVSLLLAVPAQAIVISDYVSFMFGPDSLQGLKNIKNFATLDTSANGSAVVATTTQMKSLSRFDPSLGVLTDVTIGWKSSWKLVGGTGAKRWGKAYAEGKSGIGMQVKAVDPLTAPVNKTDSFLTSCKGYLVCGDIDYRSGDFGQVFNPVNLGTFIGLDPLDFMLTHKTLADLLRCKGKCATGSASKWYGKLFVKYTYDERDVPEPSLLALIGLGLLGISAASAVKRRRNG